MDKTKLQALFRAKAEARESGAARPAPGLAELRAAHKKAVPDAGQALKAAHTPPLPAALPQLPSAPRVVAASAPPPPASWLTPAPPASAADDRERPAAARGDEPPAKRANVSGALPAGFFDDKAADAKARGVAPPAQDAAAALREFEASISADVKQVEERELVEQAEEADDKEGLLQFEQQLCVARVEELKQQAAARRQAALQRQHRPGSALVRPNAGAADEHSSDSGSDSPDDSLVDWRAKRV